MNEEYFDSAQAWIRHFETEAAYYDELLVTRRAEIEKVAGGVACLEMFASSARAIAADLKSRVKAESQEP